MSKKLKVYSVSGDFKDGNFWPDRSPSYTHRNATLRAYDAADAIKLCEAKFGEPDLEDVSVSELPHGRGVHWS